MFLAQPFRISTSLNEIAKRSRGTPRIGNRLIKRDRDFSSVIADGGIDKEITMKALDARIFDLNALKAKSGASFSKANQRELKRLTDAREYYGGVRETLNDVATGKLRPGEYEDAILKNSGDKDLLETISDMRDLMKSLVF